MSAPARLPNPASSRAVLIGCASYTELADRPSIITGVTDLRTILTSPATGGFIPHTCQVLRNPDQARGLVELLLATARETTDTLLIYYSGHGLLDNRNQLHLAMATSSKDKTLIPDSALNYDRIRDVLRESTARNKVVILDCCYSGRAIPDLADPDDLADLAAIHGAYVLAATDPTTTALAPTKDRYTVFTGTLIDLLRGGIPDGPDLLTLEILYSHLYRNLKHRGLPVPHHQGTDTITGLALTRNPTPRSQPESAVQEHTRNPRRRPKILLLILGVLSVTAVIVIVLIGPRLVTSSGTTARAPSTTSVPAPSPHTTTQAHRTAALTGHAGSVTSVAWSPNGETLATGGVDGTIRLWNPATGTQIGQPLTGHAGSVWSVAWSPDGETLATGGVDGTIRLWNPATHTQIGQSIFDVYPVAWSPDGKTLVSTGDTIRLWNPATGTQIGQPFTGHAGSVWSVAWSPDGKTLATGGKDKTVRLWNPATGTQIGQPLTGHTDSVWSVAWSPDSRTLATGGVDGTIRLWNPATHTQIGHLLTEQTDSAKSVAWSPDGKTLATGGQDKTVRLWNPATGTQIGQPLTGHTDWVNSVAWSSDGKTLATASDDHTIRLWPVL